MDIRPEGNILPFRCEQAFYGFFSPHRSIGHIDRVEDSNVFLYSLLAAMCEDNVGRSSKNI